jgi:hypothetical protein
MNRPSFASSRVSPPPTPRGSNESVYFNGHTFKQGERFDRIQFHRPSVGDPFVSLPTAHQGRFLPAILQESDAQHLQDKEFISVELTGFRIGGNYPRVTCKRVGSLDAQPLPAAAKPLNTLAAVVTDLAAKIKDANTPQALLALPGRIRSAGSRFGAANLSEATYSWCKKTAEMVRFYIQAHAALGWSQEAVRQYDDMAKLVKQLSLLQPSGEAFVLPDHYNGQLSALHREHAWTSGEVEAKLASLAEEERTREARLAAERAEQALNRNGFNGKPVEDLLAVCGTETPLTSEAVLWLQHITGDDGRPFLTRYPSWESIAKAQPEVFNGLMAYFKAVLARVG